MTWNHSFGVVVCATVLAAVSGVCRAETILFESGMLGPTGLAQGEVPGTNVRPGVINGVRFELSEPVKVDEIGGHFVGELGGSFFGAIVQLDSESDFPNSGDLSSSDVLDTADLNFPTLSAETFGEVDVQLEPGWYAVLFGSGLFDTLGAGVAPRNNPDIGNPDYIGFQEGIGWHRLGLTGTVPFVDHRFVLKGQVVPEPSTIAICTIGFICFMLHKRA